MVALLESITSIFSNQHTGSVVGIDIGASSIKVVEIEKINERAVLKNYGEIILGPLAGVSAGQATNLSTEQLSKALNDLLREAGMITKHTAIAIPFSASLISVVELPNVGKKEMESMIPLGARRYIPVPLSEVSLDWWVLPKRNTEEKQMNSGEREAKKLGKTEVIIAVIHNDVFKKYEMIKEAAKIPPGISHFEIEVFSMLRSVVGRNIEPSMVIDIGAGSTKITIVDAGIVRGSHAVSVGGQNITRALSISKGISFDEAEEIKCRVGIVGDDEGRDVSAAADLILSNIMNEALHFVQNYENKYESKIKKIILVGGGARLKGIEKIIGDSFLEFSVEIGDPFAHLATPAFLRQTLKSLSPNFAVAIGVALKGLEE